MRCRFTTRSPAGRLILAAVLGACSSNDRPTAPGTRPEFAISDAAHEGGTPGFYFLPPMVAQPTYSGTFDADITTLNPAIAICDVTNGVANDCGAAGGTPAVVAFTTTSTPAITVDPTTPQYQVNWDTQAAGFVAGHTYRVHVTAGATGARRELGFADVLLTATPGQAKNVETGDLIVANDGRTLPIHFRVETGIPGTLSVSAATATVTTGGTDLITATVQDLHGLPVAGATVAWSVTTTPVTGVADATQPLNPTSGQSDATGTTATMFKAGATAGVATVTAASAGLSATATVTVGCNCWTTKAPMPTARYGLAAGVVNGILYAHGGASSTSIVNTLEAYDPATSTWTTKAAMPTARFYLAGAVVNGILYADGGALFGGVPQTTLEAYDPVTNTWTTKAAMPTARWQLAVGVVNGILYAVGGSGSSGAVNALEAYDPATNTWTTKAAMPTARYGLAAGVVNGILYAVGGVNQFITNVATLEAYDPATNSWTTKAAMPTARNGLAVGVVNGILYAVGGSGTSGDVNAEYVDDEGGHAHREIWPGCRSG